MTKHEYLTAANLAAKNVFIMGNNEDKDKTCRLIINTWDEIKNGALVVFDHDGHLYNDLGQDQLLADFSSQGSMRPDLVSPILRHDKHGKSPVSAAEVIRAAVAPEKAEKGCNDQFWNANASETLRTWIEYAIAIAQREYIFEKIAHEDRVEYFDVLYAMSCCSDYLTCLMSLVVANDFDANVKSIGNNSNKDILMHYIRTKYDSFATPFSETLKNGGNYNGYTTALSILKTTKSNGKFFLRFMDMLACNKEEFKGFPLLDINEYVRDTKGRALYVCSSGDNDADTAYAALFLCALAAAAEKEEKPVTILIPEIDKWDVLRQITDLPMFFRRRPYLIFGYKSMQAAERSMSISDTAFLGEADDIADITLWHKSDDIVINRLFAGRVNDKDAIYPPSDLGNGLVAIEQSGSSAVKYMYEKSQPQHMNKCTRVPIKPASSEAWFYASNAGTIEDINKQLLLENRKKTIAHNGVPKGLVDCVLSAGLLNEGPIGPKSVNDAFLMFLALTMQTKIEDGLTNEIELNNILAGIAGPSYEVSLHKKDPLDGEDNIIDFDDDLGNENYNKMMAKVKKAAKAGGNDSNE